eukprot:Blabericola_migrator_1__4054@NODE_2235_length_3076_cov_13_810568_g1408_i0_p3_GENE_NODE_2235_length_3076_cov_13_810568_g1408_i0NODE_2235_length_3076_cov_13_810568_g1408_i0_p3_ORF_typecomplete_len124_score0_58Integrin_beta/PF00362_18/1_4e05_NODE_2235_length_3076_cov_13_810568_g1408_i06361007
MCLSLELRSSTIRYRRLTLHLPRDCQAIITKFVTLQENIMLRKPGFFHDDLPNVVVQIPRMVDQIQDQHLDSWIGVAEFKDKPYFPLGKLDYYCYKLNDGSLTSNMARFAEPYEKKTVGLGWC